jgi:hypothetical protein
MGRELLEVRDGGNMLTVLGIFAQTKLDTTKHDRYTSCQTCAICYFQQQWKGIEGKQKS